jgi:hypothetical protein
MTSSGVILQSSDVMNATLSYDGTTPTETITDTVTHATFTTQYAVDIPTIVGGNVAYVGFTGGTGGLTAVQDIQTWTYTTQDAKNGASSPAGGSPAIAGAQPAAAVLPSSTAGGVSPVLASPAPAGAVDAALALYAEDPTSRKVALKVRSLLF